MIGEAQSILSKSLGAVSSSGSGIKALAGSHPVVLGVVLGIGAYYAINKYLLENDDEENIDTAEESETTEEQDETMADSTTTTA